MKNANPNWCYLLSGVVTSDLVRLLARASEFAKTQGSTGLAAELAEWEARLSFATETTEESSNRPEIWVG